MDFDFEKTKKGVLQMVREIKDEKHLLNIYYFTLVQHEHDQKEHPGAKDDAKAEIIGKIVDLLEILPCNECERLHDYITELYLAN